MGHRARKRFGQNFLTDPQIIQRIVNTINPVAGELVLEIGPGQAALSRPLAETDAELHLLEIDRDLAFGHSLINVVGNDNIQLTGTRENTAQLLHDAAGLVELRAEIAPGVSRRRTELVNLPDLPLQRFEVTPRVGEQFGPDRLVAPHQG